MTEERYPWAIIWDNNHRRWVDSKRRGLPDEAAAISALQAIADEHRSRGWHHVAEREGGRQWVLGPYWPDGLFTVSAVELSPEVLGLLGQAAAPTPAEGTP